jgi:hypothetical protein
LKTLLTITAIFEGITGLALIVVPALVVSVLLGAPLVDPAGLLVSRLTGIALISLTIMCWVHRDKEDQANGAAKAMVFYNIAVAALLVYAWMNGFRGLGIWPASVLHVGLAVWCIKSLQNMRSRKSKN